MKKLMMSVLLLSFVAGCYAQEKKWNHIISFGIGLGFDNQAEGKAFVLRTGYNLEYRFSDYWSLNTGLTYRQVAAYGGLPGFFDIPLAVGIRPSVDSRWTFSLGPSLTICAVNSKYDMDNSLNMELVGNKRFKGFGLGLQPKVSYRFASHWILGIEGYIGLTNIKRQYPQTMDKLYLHSVTAKIGYLF